MLGVILDRDTVDLGDLELAALRATLPQWHEHGVTAPHETTARLAGAQVAVSNKVVIDAAVMAACPDLRLICIAATGTNNVDLEAARRHGVAVRNVTRYATLAVVQHTFALILSLTQRLREYDRSLQAGAWGRSPMFCLMDHPIRELAGRTLGIVGYGELGHGVARVAEAFGMHVAVAQRPGSAECPEGRLPLDELLATADVLTLHCPLTPETRDLIGARELARMKPDALLINTARGGIVDETALLDALRAGRLGGAGLDVLAVEPPRDGNPLLDADLPNLIVTPHIAWSTREARQRLMDQVAENVRSFVQGGEYRWR